MNAISTEGSASIPERLTQFPEIENIGPTILEISERPINTSGGFGDLYLGTHTTAGKVALKRPRLVPEDQDLIVAKLFLLEAEAWRGLAHPHVLEFIGVAEINGFIHLVSPYIANGTLVAFMKNNPGVDRPRLLGETADAIAFLHKCEIIHGDIKANNILVSDDIHALLCDFGLARTNHSATATGVKGSGSLRWQSPEVWREGPKSFKSDAYSFGMTIFEVLTSKIPFSDCKTDYAVINAAFFRHERPRRPSFARPLATAYSYVWDIAEMCVAASPEARPDMGIVHPLFGQLLWAAGSIPQPQLVSASQLRSTLERGRHSGTSPGSTSQSHDRNGETNPDNPDLTNLLVSVPELAPAVSALDMVFSLIPKISYKRVRCRRLATDALAVMDDLRARHAQSPDNRSRLIDIAQKVNRILAMIQVDVLEWTRYGLWTGWLNRRNTVNTIRKHKQALNECMSMIGEFEKNTPSASSPPPQDFPHEISNEAEVSTLPAPLKIPEMNGSSVTQAPNDSMGRMDKSADDTPPASSPTRVVFMVPRAFESDTSPVSLEHPETNSSSVLVVDLTPRLKTLGTRPAKVGGASDVWEGELAPNNMKVAVKCLRVLDVGDSPAESRGVERLKLEMRVWMPLEHPFLLKCLGMAIVDGIPAVISPWCKNGNAREYLDANPSCNRKAMIFQVAEGLAYLHGGVVPTMHYNIKLSNVMIGDDERAMLTDAGVARVIEDSRTGLTTSNNGDFFALRYASPEAIEGSERTVKSDVFGFGCLALEVTTNKAPFYNIKSSHRIVQSVFTGRFPDPKDFPELTATDPLWGLLRRCWDRDPNKRPTMDQVLTELLDLGYHA